MSSRSPEGRSRYLKSLGKTLLLLLVLPAGLVGALPEDRDQPIHISADKALRDEKQGFTVYTGNVQMTQGSMEIEADKLTIYHITDEADKIVAEGQPAKMRQQPELDKGLVHAHADVIEYFKIEERVHLEKNARIEQDGALVTGDSIDYFIAEQLVKADSNQAEEGNRVQVVIPPSMTQEAQTPPPTAQPGAATPPATTLPATDTPSDNEQQPEESGSGTTDSE